MVDMMQAAVYYGPEDIRVEDRPIPEIGPDEALLKVVATSICGTDLRIYKGGHRWYPDGTVRVPGHEVVGTIEKVGESVTSLEVGGRYFVAPNMVTGANRISVTGNNNLSKDFAAIGISMDGSFAEYIRIPSAAILQGNLIPISEDVDPAVAALIEPFACVLRGQKPLNIQPGEGILIVGAGPIGIMHILLAQLSGAAKVLVSEINSDRGQQALDFGADRVINPLEEDLAAVVEEETDGWGMDVVITAAPAHKAQEQAIEVAAIGGRINFFGGLPKDRPTITLDSNAVHYKELLVTGTTACSTADCWEAARIVSSGKIDLSSVVSMRFPLSQAKEAFEAAKEQQALKIALEPGK